MDIGTMLAPLKTLFQNRTFVTSIIGALVAVLVGLVPTLAPYQTQVVSVVVALVLLSAGGEAVANATKPTADAKVQVAMHEAEGVKVEAAADVQRAQLNLEAERVKAVNKAA